MTSRLAHHRARVDHAGNFLVTRVAAVQFGVGATERYIRKACRPVACDTVSRAVLYDLDELVERFPQRAA